MTSGYSRSLGRQGRVFVCVSPRRREGRGKEEVKGSACAPCALVESGSCGGMVCEEAVEEDDDEKRNTAKIQNNFGFFFKYLFHAENC